MGIHRTYYLNITDREYNADGLSFSEGKFFNSTYPGPWIQACQGNVKCSFGQVDKVLECYFSCSIYRLLKRLTILQNVTIIVENKFESKGTSIHWYGIRQGKTMHMNGVNGITQCLIAPGDSFDYTFRAMQYGSSRYHSHYSVQHADGAVEPLVSLCRRKVLMRLLSRSFFYYNIVRRNVTNLTFGRQSTVQLYCYMTKRKI